MQAIELETAITHGEIHLRLPQEITADKAKVIVLFENTPSAEPPSNQSLLQFLDGLVANRNWELRTKEEIDQALDDSEGAMQARTPLWAGLEELRTEAERQGSLPVPLSCDGILLEMERRRDERDD